MSAPIKIGQIYEYKNKHYRVFSVDLKIKDRISREWFSAVGYADCVTGEVFARELEDFKSKFLNVASSGGEEK
jgi:hypothetical protein